jgi:serine/threonine-protein kinase
MNDGKQPSTSLIGHLVDDRYRVDRIVGQGGYGVVCQGTQISVGRRVAVKLLLPQHAGDPEMEERFAREARAASRIRNRHVVQLVDFGLDGSVPFIVMEWLRGPTLKEVLQDQQTLHWTLAATIARDIALGLAAAHGVGLAHRDLKPSNILFESTPSSCHPVLVDFGLAKAFVESDTTEETLTHSNMMVGTPAYMAPEVVSGEEFDGRGDLYALGILLCEMITGAPPFKGRTQLETATKHLVAKRPKPSFFEEFNVPANLATFIIQLLDREPASRPETAARTAAFLQSMTLDAHEPRFREFSARVETLTQSLEAERMTGRSDPDAASEKQIESAKRHRLTSLLATPRPSELAGRSQSPDSGTDEDSVTVPIHEPGTRGHSGDRDNVTIAPSAQRTNARPSGHRVRTQASQTPQRDDRDSERENNRRATRRSTQLSQETPSRWPLLASSMVLFGGLTVLAMLTMPETIDHGESPAGPETIESHASVQSMTRSMNEQQGASAPTVTAEHERQPQAAEHMLETPHAAGRTSSFEAGESAPAAPSNAPAAKVPLPQSRSQDAGSQRGTSDERQGSTPPHNADSDLPGTEPASQVAAPGTAINEESTETASEAGEASTQTAAPAIEPPVTPEPAKASHAPPPPLLIRARPWAEIFVDGQSHGRHSVYRWQPEGNGSFIVEAAHGEQRQRRRLNVDGTSEHEAIQFLFLK